MDPMRKLAVSSSARSTSRLISSRSAPGCPDRRRELPRKLEMDRQRDQVLLRTLVELALDAPPLRRSGEDEAPAGRP